MGRWRDYLFFAVATAGLLMAAIDSTIVAVGLPTMMSSLETNLVLIGWTLTAYQLANTVVLPVWGQLSDTRGRRQMFLLSLGVFTFGSLLCGLAPNIYVLIGARVIQAIGGGGIMPSATGIVSDQFAENRAQAIGLFSSVFPIGGIVGPNLGGWILANFTWRELFFVNVPIGIAALVAAWFLIPKRPASGKRRPLDVVGSSLFAAGIIAILYALTTLGTDEKAYLSPVFWIELVGGFVLLGLFVRHESRVEHPIVEMRLLKERAFFAANFYNFLFGAAAFGFFSFVPYYAQVVYRASPAETGLILTPRAGLMISFSFLASLVFIRYSYRIPMIAGMVLIAVTNVLLSLEIHNFQIVGWAVPDFWLVAAIVGLSGIAMGIANPASNNAAIELLPGRTAAVTGLRGMFRFTGGILSVAVIVVVLSHFEDKAAGIRIIFAVLALILLSTIPFTFMIPDGPWEKWRKRVRGSATPARPASQAAGPANSQSR